MTHPHWRLILNGKSASDDAVRDAVVALRARGIALDVRVTWETGDAQRQAAEGIDDGVDTLIAGGGDGTVSEIAAALAQRGESAARLPGLAILPLGTANDFATAAGLPDAPLAALELPLSAPAVPVDLLRIDTGHGTRWCANLASGGFGTEVTAETDEGLKKVLGGLAYLVTGIAKLGRIDPLHARFGGPDFAWEGDFIALGIGNGRQAGGGQVLCPQALIDDGLMDLTIVPELSGEMAGTFGKLVTAGKQAALERVAVCVRLPWLEIDAGTPMILNLDGEPVESRHFRIECVAARVLMHLPPECPLLSRNGAPV